MGCKNKEFEPVREGGCVCERERKKERKGDWDASFVESSVQPMLRTLFCRAESRYFLCLKVGRSCFASTGWSGRPVFSDVTSKKSQNTLQNSRSSQKSLFPRLLTDGLDLCRKWNQGSNDCLQSEWFKEGMSGYVDGWTWMKSTSRLAIPNGGIPGNMTGMGCMEQRPNFQSAAWQTTKEKSTFIYSFLLEFSDYLPFRPSSWHLIPTSPWLLSQNECSFCRCVLFHFSISFRFQE